MSNDKIDYRRRIVKAMGMVAYAGFVNHFDFAAKQAVSRFDDGRVLRNGNDIISIANDVNDGNMRFGKRSERIDRISRVGERFRFVMEMIATD